MRKRQNRPEPYAAETVEGNNRFTMLFPTTGHDLSDRFMKCVFELERFDRANDYHLFSNFIANETGCNIANGRNMLVKYFLEQTDDDWAFFCDTDMVFEPETPYRLMAAATHFNIPIMGALCVIVTPDSAPIPTLYRHDPDTVTVAALDIPDSGGVLEVAATGTGCLMIHRSVLVAMQEAMNGGTHWFYEDRAREADNGGHFWIGEDVTFCLDAVAQGHRVGVDTTTPVGHHKGSRTYWPSDVRSEATHPNVVIMLDASDEDYDGVVSQGGFSSVIRLTSNGGTNELDLLNDGIQQALGHSQSANILITDHAEFDQQATLMAAELRRSPRVTAVESDGGAIMVRGEWFRNGWQFTDENDILDDIRTAEGIVHAIGS